MFGVVGEFGESGTELVPAAANLAELAEGTRRLGRRSHDAAPGPEGLNGRGQRDGAMAEQIVDQFDELPASGYRVVGCSTITIGSVGRPGCGRSAITGNWAV